MGLLDLLNLQNVAASVGGTEPALRLFISILLGYPIVLIHRNFLYGKSKALQHLYFISTGVAVGTFCYGWGIVHPIIATLFVYTTLCVNGGTFLSVIITLGFTMTYLSIGYLTTSTDDYDIKWTMSQCVLTLRLIGVTIDLYDGQQPEGSVSKENQLSALQKVPSLLEIGGHSFFPAAFLVGPQFHMRRYQQFVNGSLIPSTRSGKPNSFGPAMKRLATGLFYLSMHQIGATFIPESYLESPGYAELGFIKKHLVLGLWGKIVLYKYITCWLVSEGVCILSGISYSGVDERQVEKWDSCRNVKLSVFENTSRFNHYILSFNTNTNAWVAQYVYKRMKFLNSKLLSQGVSLMFLAVWHGFHSGYYVCFANEFIVLLMEREVESLVAKNEKVTNLLSRPQARPLMWIILKLYTIVFMGYSLVPFVLLSFGRYWAVYKSLYFSGYILFLGWHAYKPVVRYLLKPARSPVHAD